MNPNPPLQSEEHTSRGRFFRLTYSNARQDDDPKLFKGRDGVAFCELTAVLPKLGYEYGTTIHLYPDDKRLLTEFPAFQPSDLLVLPTRPPLHDKIGLTKSNRKIIHAAKTELEAALFKELSRYFEYCTRKHLELSTYGASLLQPKEPQKWEHVELYEYSGAEIMQHFIGPQPLEPEEDHRSTIAFFLRANQVPDLGCDFIASFGMDGYGTLIWNRIVRKQHPDWLSKPCFVMAELIFKKDIPQKPLTPEFIDDGTFIEVNILT